MRPARPLLLLLLPDDLAAERVPAAHEERCDRARALTASLTVTATNLGTVSEASSRWLASYVQTQRNEEGRRLTEQRVRDYIDPYFGTQLVGRVACEDVRSFRLWLEHRTSL